MEQKNARSFVAEFVGTMNRVESTVADPARGTLAVGGEHVEVDAARGRPQGEHVLLLVRPEGDELQGMLRDGLRQVKASTGEGGVCTVVEVAPWSRIPEQRALLVARDE